MGANPAGPLELAMTHYADGRACQRPGEVRVMVERLLRWTGTAETCQSCTAAPALTVVSGVALCSRCREQRAARMTSTEELSKRVATRGEPVAGEMLRGTAIVFDSWSVDLGGFTERIRPQAVNRMINNSDDVRALWNHNSDLPLGRSTARTMRYWKESDGLGVSIVPPSWGRDYIETVQRGDVSGMSFGFKMIEDEWVLDGTKARRDVLDMLVSEVSAVAFPAYPQTRISVGAPLNRVAFLQKVQRNRAAR